ncbi:hypothetical protein BH10BAC4_BH10BAC4_08800 [soil metagenome]
MKTKIIIIASIVGIASLIGATKASTKIIIRPNGDGHYSASTPIEPVGGFVSEDH